MLEVKCRKGNVVGEVSEGSVGRKCWKEDVGEML